jgi:rhodanese-related sulfurtransferase
MPGSPQLPEVSAAAVSDDAFLLDVREPEEWAAGHAPEAYHVPMNQLLARLDEVPADRDVVVVCRVGSRSAQVVAYLQANGWSRTSNLHGGMYAWQAAGRPMTTEDGRPAHVL